MSMPRISSLARIRLGTHRLLQLLLLLAIGASCVGEFATTKSSLNGISFTKTNKEAGEAVLDKTQLVEHLHTEIAVDSFHQKALQAYDTLKEYARKPRAISRKHSRRLDEQPTPPKWEAIYVGLALFFTFAVLLWDKIGADWVLVIALAFCMASQIISVKEGLAGFASEGLWTVMVLFVIAAGIGNTGALDWYMIKLLGKPRNIADAHLRVFIPVTIISAFLNNTPIVVIMIPVIQRWSRNIGVNPSQLMLPMVYAVVVGGTCTFIGSSTNLVALGYLEDNEPDVAAELNYFSLGAYGVPYALIAHSYMFLFSWLLPGAEEANEALTQRGEQDPVLLGARLTKWSSAAGRTVKRSGLRETGGIYLVSVYRASTGNLHRAVGQEFVLNINDVLYFAGLVEEFPKFCEENGLEIVTNENRDRLEKGSATGTKNGLIGTTKDSLASADANLRMRIIYKIIDAIHGKRLSTGEHDEVSLAGDVDPTQILVTHDNATQDNDLVVIGVNSRDRPGLLHDVAKTLLRLNLQCHRTEAAVVGLRSLSVWRCEVLRETGNELDEIWESLKELLGSETGFKQTGLSIVRATVTPRSRLIGATVGESNFREAYKAAIVAVQRGGKNITDTISKARFEAGDLVIVQAYSDSYLLERPEDDFYKKLAAATAPRFAVRASVSNLVKSFCHPEPNGVPEEERPDDYEAKAAVWKDLQVAFSAEDKAPSREFLTATKVSNASPLAKKSAAALGLTTLPGIVLVSIERPSENPQVKVVSSADAASVSSYVDNPRDVNVESIPFDEPLAVGDILWFAGLVGDVSSLRKIPGLESFESDQVGKIKGKVFERRLVQAVIAKRSPLVGQTPTEAKFRTRYGAAVIAVNREGKRLHEHPGRVKLRAGDVLLLEAGPSFIKNNNDSDRSFALLAEVENSAPPRLRMLIPAVVLLIATLVVASVGLCSLLISGLFCAILYVAIGILSQQEARNALNWFVFVTVGASFGIGTAMENSGFSTLVANGFVAVGNAVGLGDAGIYGAIYVATALITNIVTNNAAAALMMPIAIPTAQLSGASIILTTFAVVFGASACYMSPFGYQCNLLVYGPGNYTTADYLKFGSPLQLLLFFYAVIILAVNIAWYWAWIWSAGIWFLAAALGVFGFTALVGRLLNRSNPAK